MYTMKKADDDEEKREITKMLAMMSGPKNPVDGVDLSWSPRNLVFLPL